MRTTSKVIPKRDRLRTSSGSIHSGDGKGFAKDGLEQSTCLHT